MRSHLFGITILSIAALAAGCDQEKSTSRQMEKVSTETKEAARDMNDYTFAQKTEFTEKMQSQLTEINKELDQLAAKVENSSATAKAEATPKLQALRTKADQLGTQLEHARNATESTWGDVKAAVKSGYGDLKDGFQHASQWVADKLAH